MYITITLGIASDLFENCVVAVVNSRPAHNRMNVEREFIRMEGGEGEWVKRRVHKSNHAENFIT